METQATLTVDDSQAAEVGTIEHEGRSYSASGFSLDVETGRMVAYVDAMAAWLTTWSGERLCRIHQTGEARGFHGTTLYCYQTAPFLGHHWYGRGLGASMFLRLKRGRAV